MDIRDIEDSNKLNNLIKQHKSTASQAYFNFIKSNLGIGIYHINSNKVSLFFLLLLIKLVYFGLLSYSFQ